jgi:hypothetical protein
MKKCPYCGQEYVDTATICAFDQTELDQPRPGESQPSQRQHNANVSESNSMQTATKYHFRRLVFVNSCVGALIFGAMTFAYLSGLLPSRIEDLGGALVVLAPSEILHNLIGSNEPLTHSFIDYLLYPTCVNGLCGAILVGYITLFIQITWHALKRLTNWMLFRG